MTFGKRLVQLRKEKGFTRESFAEYLEISKYTLRNYEMDTNEPNSFLLKKLSEIFNVSIDYLLCMTDEREKTRQYALKSSEYEHIKKYRVLDDHGKEIVDIVLEKEYDRSMKESKKPEMPLHLMPVAAHNDNQSEEQERLMREDLDEL